MRNLLLLIVVSIPALEPDSLWMRVRLAHWRSVVQCDAELGRCFTYSIQEGK